MRQTLVAAVISSALGSVAYADTFGSGELAFEIPFVTVGSPGNAADTTGDPSPAGSVPYVYRIGQFEVPEEAVRKANAITEAAGEPLGLTPRVERGERKPATGLRWPEIARFVNFLNEDQGFQPAYKFDDAGEFQLWQPTDPGFNTRNLFRNSLARYVLPSVDEWYKAAFYDPVTQSYFDFATGSDEPPIPAASGTAPGTAVYQQLGPADVGLAGGQSPFGTFGQSGNVIEFHETAFDLVNDTPGETRSHLGGDWRFANSAVGLSSSARGQFDLASRPLSVGFRVVRVPEPRGVLVVSLLVILFTSYACGRVS